MKKQIFKVNNSSQTNESVILPTNTNEKKDEMTLKDLNMANVIKRYNKENMLGSNINNIFYFLNIVNLKKPKSSQSHLAIKDYEMRSKASDEIAEALGDGVKHSPLYLNKLNLKNENKNNIFNRLENKQFSNLTTQHSNSLLIDEIIESFYNFDNDTNYSKTSKASSHVNEELLTNENDLIKNDVYETSSYHNYLNNSREHIKKRGKYRKYEVTIKKFILNLLTIKDVNVKSISKFFDIPIKSLVRWKQIGAERKVGSGRKPLNAKLEEQLINWYKKEKNAGNGVTRLQFLRKAKCLSENNKFLASTGWLEKVKKKHNLEFIYIRRIQNHK